MKVFNYLLNTIDVYGFDDSYYLQIVNILLIFIYYNINIENK